MFEEVKVVEEAGAELPVIHDAQDLKEVEMPKEEEKTNKALFIDLDWTLIETLTGDRFPDPDNYLQDWKFRPGILTKLREYVKNGFVIVIVTNQGGIERGYVKPGEFAIKIGSVIQNINRYIFGSYNVPVQGNWVVAIVADSMRSVLRKPRPDAAFMVRDKMNLDLDQCVMVGDASGLERVNKFMPYSEINSMLSVSGIINTDLISVGPKSKKDFIERVLDHVGMEGCEFTHKMHGIKVIKNDHSDSDRKFAENAGIGNYIDVETFINS